MEARLRGEGKQHVTAQCKVYGRENAGNTGCGDCFPGKNKRGNRPESATLGLAITACDWVHTHRRGNGGRRRVRASKAGRFGAQTRVTLPHRTHTNTHTHTHTHHTYSKQQKRAKG